MSVTHAKVTGLPGDGSDVTFPDWDADHVIADGSITAAKLAFGTSRWVDCGVIDLAALFLADVTPLVLVPEVAGQYISTVRYLRDGFVAFTGGPSGGLTVDFSTPETDFPVGAGFARARTVSASGHPADTLGYMGLDNELALGPDDYQWDSAMVLSPTPLRTLIDPQVTIWTALTLWPTGTVALYVLASDGYFYSWAVTTDGITGSGEPSWPGAGYTVPVADGGGTWTQQGRQDDIAGALHVVAEVVSFT